MSLTPQQMPAADLRDLTTPDAPAEKRGHGLANLIDELPASGATRASTAVAHAEAPTPAPGADAGQAAASEPPRVAAGEGKDRVQIVVYVTAGVRKRFDDYRHRQRLTAGRVMLEAISAKIDTLADTVAAARYSTTPSSALFPPDPAAVRYLGGGTVAIPVTVTPEQCEVIADLGRSLGIETRSTWIAAVLNDFLPGRKDRLSASATRPGLTSAC